MTKYLLLRPEGGLNDILSQLSKCALYCASNERILLIDDGYIQSESLYSRTLSHLFHPNVDWIKFASGTRLIRTIQHCTSVQPPYLAGILHSYDYDFGEPCTIKCKSLQHGFPIGVSLSPERSYDEDLIVFHSRGGGKHAQAAFNYIKPSRKVLLNFSKYRSRLPCTYAAIHYRNTDWVSNMSDCIKLIYQDVVWSANQIYLATDDVCLAKRVQTFGPPRLVTNYLPIDLIHSAGLDTRSGKGLHNQLCSEFSQKLELAIFSIVELLILCNATTFQVVPLATANGQPRFSGYSLLCSGLRNSSQNLLI